MSKKKTSKKTTDRTNLRNYELLYDYVMVQAIETQTVKGLVKPNQYDDKPEFGEVIAVGEGRLLEDGTIVPPKVKPGDTIYFGKYSSVGVRSGGEDFWIIRDDDIMAVLHEKSRT